MIMKLLPIFLVLIVVCCSTSSSTQPHKDHHEVIVKEGHRVVVVEFEKNHDGSTKVLISPQEHAVPSSAVDNKKPTKEEGTAFSGPKDLVCDAYGKCKNKITNAFGKTQETVTKTVHAVSDKAHEIEQHAKEAMGKPPQHIGEAKSTFSERLSEKVPGHTFRGFLGKAKDGVTQGLIHMAKKFVENVVAIVKDGTSKRFDIIDSPKRIGEDISSNATDQIKESAQHVKEQAKESVKNVQEVLMGQRSLNDIVNRLKEMAYDVIGYVLFRDKLGLPAGLVHVLGFSMAYGMCMWVTFVSSYILGRSLSRQMFGMVQSRIYPVYFRAMAYCVSCALLGHVVGEKSEVLASKTGMFQSLSLLSALLMVLTNMIFVEPKATKAIYKRMRLEKEEGRGLAAAVSAKDGMVDGSGATVVRSSANGRGVRVAAATLVKDGMMDGLSAGATMVRSTANGKGIWVAAKDGMTNRGSGTLVRSVAVERQDLLRLNERLKRLNAYSSALNLFTLVTLTWHMAYMGQRLQAICSN